MADLVKGGEVVVQGLPELLRDLKAMERRLPRQVTAAHRRAAKVVEGVSRAKALAQGGSMAKAAPGIKAAATQRSAKIVLDASRHPYILGAEFGAKRYPQFPRWRGNKWAPDEHSGVGYAVHPAVRETREDFIEVYADEVQKVLDGIGR